MKTTKLVILASLLALLALVSGASALTVVNFDDLKGNGLLPATYAGLSWDPNWQYYSNPQFPYTPHSDPVRVYTWNYGGWIEFPQPVDFKGAWFAGDGQSQIHFVGYKNGVEVGQSPTIAMTSTPTFLGAGFSTNVDKVQVVSSSFDYFVMDDFTYGEGSTVAPEFPSLFLPLTFIIGFLGMVLYIRRTREN